MYSLVGSPLAGIGACVVQSLLSRMEATSRLLSATHTQRIPWQGRRSHAEAKARASAVGRPRSESSSSDYAPRHRSESAGSDGGAPVPAGRVWLSAFMVAVGITCAALLTRNRLQQR
jgi:hypothetical protein